MTASFLVAAHLDRRTANRCERVVVALDPAASIASKSQRCFSVSATAKSPALFQRESIRKKHRHPRACEDPRLINVHGWVLAFARMTASILVAAHLDRRTTNRCERVVVALEPAASIASKFQRCFSVSATATSPALLQRESIRKKTLSSSRMRGPTLDQRPRLGPRFREDDGALFSSRRTSTAAAPITISALSSRSNPPPALLPRERNGNKPSAAST